jgi:3D (Asp-Asp-Asp) domain-containing protein
MSFHNKFHNQNKIKIAVYTHCIKNGGRARVTALLLKYLYKIKIFDLYLFTNRFKEDNEYIIPENIKRVIIKKDIIKYIKKNKIDVFIYELDEVKEISFLNKFKNSKVIFSPFEHFRLAL